MPVTSPVPKYHRIELALAARIRDGLYDQAGLPGERELAHEFQAARVTIRSALRRLEDQGVLVRRQRQGTLVAAGHGAAPMRRMLREHIDAFLDRGRKDKRRVLRFGFVPAPPAVAEALSLRAREEVLRVVRLRSDATGTLTYTEAFLPKPLAPAVTRTALERQAFVKLLEDAKVKIGMADQAAVAEEAPLAASKALGLPLHAPILKMSRLLRDETGKPVQWLVCWYRADRFELRMQLSRPNDATRVWVGYRA